MVKLFALEEDKDSVSGSNDLLIDKILGSAKSKDDSVSLTAEIIKKREELKAVLQKHLEGKTDNQNQDNSENNETENSNKNDSKEEEPDNLEESSDTEDTEGTKDTKDNEDSEDSEDSSGNEDNSNKKEENKEDEIDELDDIDEESMGIDEEDLEKGNKKEKNKDKEDKKENKDKEEKNKEDNTDKKDKQDNKDKEDTEKKNNITQESFKLPRRKIPLSNIFKPIKDIRVRYLAALEEFNIPNKKIETNYKVAYVKESVVEALNNFITVANNYIAKNKTFIDNNTTPVKNINERLTVLREFIKERKYHFTHKLVNDQKILSEISVVNKSNPRDTSKILLNYIHVSNQFVNHILNNDFNVIKSALSHGDFNVEEDDYVYKEILPGFNMIRVHIDHYENYLKTNIENFHYYQIKTFKAEHLYDLDAISISNDKEIDFIMDKLDNMLVELTMILDNFNTVNSGLNKLIDEVKILVYDIEQDKYSRLAELDIDSKIKDFIKFKLVSEAYYCNTNMLINYILNMIEVINKSIELKP